MTKSPAARNGTVLCPETLSRFILLLANPQTKALTTGIPKMSLFVMSMESYKNKEICRNIDRLESTAFDLEHLTTYCNSP